MATTTLLTVKDLENMPELEEGRYELSRGVLIDLEKEGELKRKAIHELVKATVNGICTAYCAGKPFAVFPESDIVLDEDTYRRPDVAIFVKADIARLNSEYLTVVPSIAIEVISPSERASYTSGKVADYFRAGVKEVWQFYPIDSEIVVRTPEKVRIVTMDQVLETPLLPGFSHAASEFFAR